jgi:hypothetical protein
MFTFIRNVLLQLFLIFILRSGTCISTKRNFVDFNQCPKMLITFLKTDSTVQYMFYSLEYILSENLVTVHLVFSFN